MMKKGVYPSGVWFVFLLLLFSTGVFGQNVILKPASTPNNDGVYQTKLLLKKNKVFRVEWTQLDGTSLNLSGEAAKLIIGRSSNNYDVMELSIDGESSDFIPDDIGLSPGRYYARITNSSQRTTSAIQEDQQTNSNIFFSNEILLLIEADEAPAISAPRGETTNATPTFQWQAVSGVPSYWIIVSSTPFDIVEDENGDISVEGATIVWQYIGKETSVEYGAINPNSPFIDEAPPLNAGQEYSYTVLNVYEDNNPAFTSPVFGGIVPFTYKDPDAVPSTTLLAPKDEEEFFSEETITFSWEEVPEASNYTINLLQIVKQQGLNVTIPIWKSVTTNTLIEYPALENLKNGRYQWYVVSNNSNGGGTTSSSRFFQYNVETGEFGAQIRSAVDNSVILGVELTARAISGGVTPTIPYFVQSGTHYDSLVVGTYEFIAEKAGYEVGTGQLTIENGKTKIVKINLVPLPSSVQGVVEDEQGSPVEGATVELKNLSNDALIEIASNVNGEFSAFLDEGSYAINVSKSGYITSDEEIITVDAGEQKTLNEPIVITNDQATISGFVFNEEGGAVQQATIEITDGNKTYETKSNGSGAYQFTVSSGDWKLSVSKIGFVKPPDLEISLSTGDVLQNQDFVLTGNANQVTGFVRERIQNADGSTGSVPFSDVTVTAIPNVGSPISTKTEANGQYTLSLKSGSYTIEANVENYSSNLEHELVIGIAVGETISGMDFELIPNPSTLSGSVVLPNGNGVADATVQVAGVGTVTTSSSGFYSISVPQGSHTVSVSKLGLVSPDPKTISVSAGQQLSGVDFKMTPNAGSVSGTISSGGEVLLNTSVTAINTTNGNQITILNNEDGSYEFNLKSGSWYIKAEKSGFISDSTEVLNIGAGQQVVNQNLSLIENTTLIRGTITDGVQSIRNATITIKGTEGNSFNQSTVSQINGTYAFSVPAGKSYQISVSKEGYRSASQTVESVSAGSTLNQDFELAANPSSVKGTIRVEGGSVLALAKIVAINEEETRTDSTVSKTDGTYTLGLNPGEYTLEVSKPGYTTEFTSTTLSIGQTHTGIDVTVSENFAFISGTVTSSTDETPIEQAFVNLVKQGGGGASTVTDAEGNFSIPRQTGGTYTVEISKTGYLTSSKTLVFEDGDFVTITRTLTPKNGSITGTVQDENGVVISEATVIATNEEGDEYSAITNEVGNYTISALELGTYTVNAFKTGYTTAEGTLAVVSEEDLNKTGIDVLNLIPNNGVIEGRITNATTENGLKEVLVSAIGDRGSGFVLTTSDGSFEITNLIPDTYQLISSKEGFKSDTTTVTINPLNPTSNVNRSLTPNNGSIRGMVTDPNGEVLPFRVSVKASSASKTLNTRTNTKGEFTFEEVETGVTYTISTDIYREGYENVETTVLVPMGASSVELEEELKVEVSKAKISGNAGVEGASVKLLDANKGEIIEIKTAAQNGEFTFDFLKAGVYKLTVSKLGYLFTPDTSANIQLGFDDSKTQNFTAQANIATLTAVVLENGKPASNG